VSRLNEFIDRSPSRLVREDIQALARFAQRLTVDPYDVPAERDMAGEWHCIIGRSVTVPGYDLCVGYQILDARRAVYVIAFYGQPRH